MAKRISKSSSSGCGIYRESEGTIKVGLSEGSLEKNVNFFEEEITERLSELKTSQYCGSVSPFNPGGTSLGKVDRAFPNTNLTSSFTEGTPNIDADDHEPGLIVTTVVGYFYINPEKNTGNIPYGLYLGSSPNHELIVKSVGKVIKIPGSAQDKINGRPTRWAFEEGMRVHLHRIQQNPYYRILSYYTAIGDVLTLFPSFFQLVSNPIKVFISHYGIDNMPNPRPGTSDTTGIKGLWGFNAIPNGVLYQPNFMKFGKEFYLICEENKEYQFYKASGPEEAFFANNSIRIGRIPFKMECNVPVVYSSDFNTQTRYFVNLIRNCEENVHVVVDDSSSVLFVAQNYAQNMADNDFMDHVDPVTGEDMVDRIENAGITDSVYIGEILCTVTDDEIDDEDDIPKIAVYERWKTSFDHFVVLVDSAFYKASFGTAYNASTKKWYCCGLFRTTEGDENLVDSEDVFFPPAIPDYRLWIESSLALPYEEPKNIFSIYNKFSTKPTENLQLSALSYEIFTTTFWPYINSQFDQTVTDLQRRELFVSHIDKPGDFGVIGSFKEDFIKSPTNKFESYGQLFASYRKINTVGGLGFNFKTLYIEYDSSIGNNKSVYLKLYNINHRVYSYPAVYGWYNGQYIQKYISEDFSISDRPTKNGIQPPFRNSPLLQVDETEPTLVSTTDRGGDTELWIGNTYINNASDSSSGSHINPFQTINVVSVFHSNSGYTCVLYTRTKTLANEWVSWETNKPSGWPTPSGDHKNKNYGASEKYWWLRQSLWCAVVDYSGTIKANFEVKGTKPQRSDQEVETDYKPWQTVYTQPDNTSTSIIIQADGIIKEGTLEIWADHIDGKQVIIKEEETGSGFNFYVYYGDETKFSSASVSLTTGEIIVEFSIPPDEGSRIYFYADVWGFDSVYAPIHHYQEIVSYAVVEYWEHTVLNSNYQSYYNINESLIDGGPETIAYDGLMPINPNVSITEDGSYLVIGMTVAWFKKIIKGRVPRGFSGNADHSNWKHYYRYPPEPYINYNKEALTQIIVLDMDDVNVSGEPKLVIKPFLFSQLKSQLTETIILN